MNDEQLIHFLGIAKETPENRAKVLRSITPQKRALYERMAGLETELAIWQMGLGPKPKNVLVDTVRSVRRRRMWRDALTTTEGR